MSAFSGAVIELIGTLTAWQHLLILNWEQVGHHTFIQFFYVCYFIVEIRGKSNILKQLIHNT